MATILDNLRNFADDPDSSVVVDKLLYPMVRHAEYLEELLEDKSSKILLGLLFGVFMIITGLTKPIWYLIMMGTIVFPIIFPEVLDALQFLVTVSAAAITVPCAILGLTVWSLESALKYILRSVFKLHDKLFTNTPEENIYSSNHVAVDSEIEMPRNSSLSAYIFTGLRKPCLYLYKLVTSNPPDVAEQPQVKPSQESAFKCNIQ